MTASTPTRFLQATDASDTRKLALEIFGGEVFSAFNLSTIFDGKVFSRSITEGKSAKFPKIWKAASSYHTAGTQLLGGTISTGEVVITVDAILESDVEVYDLDDMLSHFDVRSPFARELGLALARTYDKNIARSIVLAARNNGSTGALTGAGAAEPAGSFPAGNVITDASLTNSGTVDGVAWIDAIRAANIALFNKDVPEDMPRYCAVNAAVFDAIRYAKDSTGQYLVLNRFFNEGQVSDASVAQRPQMLQIDGVTVLRSRNLPTTDESADASVYTKYQANYSTTTGVLWTPMAAGVLKRSDVAMEQMRDPRRLSDFMVVHMLVGHGVLRPECAVEFKTS
jgi:hypothetical protein